MLPRFKPGDAAVIAQPCDFVGINYYHPTVSSSSNPASPASTGAAVTDMGWEVAPHASADLLLRLKRDYQLPPIYITENGAAYRDQLVDGRIEDEQRRQYIESHLVAVAEAIDRGVDVRGLLRVELDGQLRVGRRLSQAVRHRARRLRDVAEDLEAERAVVPLVTQRRVLLDDRHPPNVRRSADADGQDQLSEFRLRRGGRGRGPCCFGHDDPA